LSKFLSEQDFIILPEINFTLDISSPSEQVFARMSKLRRRSIKAIKKLDYSYEITREPQKLDFFYYKMYLPYIKKRYGKSANLVSFFTANQLFRKGGLLLVKLNGKNVSGILYKPFKDTVSACCLGFYEGKDQVLDEGAGQAALYFLINWSKTQGYRQIDYGLCKPFMSDGLFTYKRSWGMKAIASRNSVLGLKVNNFNTSVIEFLSENPMISAESEGLSGLIFEKISDKRNEVFQPLYRSYYTHGLSRIVVVACSTRVSSSQSLDSSSEKRLTEKVKEKEVTSYSSVLSSKCARERDIFEKIQALAGNNLLEIKTHSHDGR